MPPYGSIPFLPKEITDARPFHRSERGRSGRVRFPPPALAQVKLDFENLSNPSNGTSTFQGHSVTQNGFTVADMPTMAGLYSIQPNIAASTQAIYTGSVALEAGSTGDVVTVTQSNGNAFTLTSIDVANQYKQTFLIGGPTITFTGNVKGGGSVSQTFTHGANNNLETFTFGGNFTNLASFSFAQDGRFTYQFDNIVLNTPVAAPEPGNVALLVGMGVTGAGLLVRRRRNRP